MSEISRRGFFGATLAGAAVPALGVAAVQTPSDGVTTEKDVAFGKGGDIELKLDIFRPPKGKEKRMATIHFHGGGFTGGSKDSTRRSNPALRRSGLCRDCRAVPAERSGRVSLR